MDRIGESFTFLAESVLWQFITHRPASKTGVLRLNLRLLMENTESSDLELNLAIARLEQRGSLTLDWDNKVVHVHTLWDSNKSISRELLQPRDLIKELNRCAESSITHEFALSLIQDGFITLDDMFDYASHELAASIPIPIIRKMTKSGQTQITEGHQS